VTRLPPTAPQTVGPFFHDGLLRHDAQRSTVAGPATAGTRIRIEGTVYDGDREPVPDAVLEIWQANHHGRYAHPADTRELPLDADFSGFGRGGTGADGAYWFETIKPGAVPFDDTQLQAPHINVALFARGLLNHLFTRLYFGDEPANNDDPVLGRVPAERRATLIAQPQQHDGLLVYRWDIVLQGTGETVFFNI
jgi:protocatechuate 3,4-dioxygenase alpha subunit